MLKDIQQRILELKKEKDVCILAHSYVTPDIIEIADFTGDSFGLAQQAAKSPCKNIMMVGVRFMAETCKILSPEKTVYLPEPDAGCPMAEQLDVGSLARLRDQHPGYTVVCYINTTSDLKVLCDVCVTSSSAVKILRRIENDRILFIPDCNLGDYVSKQVPGKIFEFINGGCPIHRRLSTMDVTAAQMAHPGAPILVHPECRPDVVAAADFTGSTTEIMKYAAESDKTEFVVGTENAISQHLSLAYPDKRFYPLSKETICPNMKLNTLLSVLRCLEGSSGEEIVLDPEIMTGARRCIDAMLKLGAD
ncbi:MAG: quinolinate synthase NadA [Oscillospiraceae bacterium]|nr:quinolinate synthase NadA [Oscillospiraceae bacterium]